jgi:hypothetical protein
VGGTEALESARVAEDQLIIRDRYDSANRIVGANVGKGPAAVASYGHWNIHGEEILLWWIIYNNPGSCTTYLCTFDLPDLAVNATARIVPRGAASLNAHLSPGGPYSGEVVLGDPAVGLTNIDGALVFLIVRYHGPATPGIIQDQLTQYAGGCPGAGAPCVDEQIIIFPGDCSGACAVPF